MTTKKPLKAKVEKKREVHTYSELWYGSEVLWQWARDEPRGSYWLWMGCLIFTAFSFEAYLNHIGSKVFKSWKVALEKALSPEGKLAVICEKLGIDLPKGEGPRQTVRELFKFRNNLAHGKTVHIEEETVRDADQYFEEFFGKRPLATWEEYCTKENAVRAREDIEQVIRLVHEKAGLENDPLFGFGMYFASASLQQDS